MKYKLIKTYPGSPKLNTIVQKHQNCNYTCDYHSINPIYVENHSEFWQPVVEKDYEILATVGNNNSLKRTIFSVKKL